VGAAKKTNITSAASDLDTSSRGGSLIAASLNLAAMKSSAIGARAKRRRLASLLTRLKLTMQMNTDETTQEEVLIAVLQCFPHCTPVLEKQSQKVTACSCEHFLESVETQRHVDIKPRVVSESSFIAFTSRALPHSMCSLYFVDASNPALVDFESSYLPPVALICEMVQPTLPVAKAFVPELDDAVQGLLALGTIQ
jgi:hypothetical protein